MSDNPANAQRPPVEHQQQREKDQYRKAMLHALEQAYIAVQNGEDRCIALVAAVGDQTIKIARTDGSFESNCMMHSLLTRQVLTVASMMDKVEAESTARATLAQQRAQAEADERQRAGQPHS